MPAEMLKGTGRLSALLEINNVLTTGGKLRSSFEQALEILRNLEKISRCAISVTDPLTGKFRVVASLGTGNVRTTENVVERVIDSGRPIVVPYTAREPLLARYKRAGSGNQSFFCVPLMTGRKTFGAIEVEVSFLSERNYEEDFLRLLLQW